MVLVLVTGRAHIIVLHPGGGSHRAGCDAAQSAGNRTGTRQQRPGGENECACVCVCDVCTYVYICKCAGVRVCGCTWVYVHVHACV